MHSDQKENTEDSVTFPQIPASTPAAAPWEMIEPGRFRPRRIKGSCVGRELGWTFVVPPGSGAGTHEHSK